jgi:hypothetical protein
MRVAENGAPDSGAQDRRDHLDHQEEGARFEAQYLFDPSRSILGIFSGGGHAVLETFGFESES